MDMNNRNEIRRSNTVVDEPVSAEERREVRAEVPRQYYLTWRPTTGGILSIVAGAINVLLGIGIVFGAGILTFSTLFVTTPVGLLVGAILIALGIVSIIGGWSAIRRSSWGWALAGAITALAPTIGFIFGLMSLIFTSLGADEFKHRA